MLTPRRRRRRRRRQLQLHAGYDADADTVASVSACAVAPTPTPTPTPTARRRRRRHQRHVYRHGLSVSVGHAHDDAVSPPAAVTVMPCALSPSLSPMMTMASSGRLDRAVRSRRHRQPFLHACYDARDDTAPRCLSLRVSDDAVDLSHVPATTASPLASSPAAVTVTLSSSAPASRR
jgi:hypothetical protein